MPGPQGLHGAQGIPGAPGVPGLQGPQGPAGVNPDDISFQDIRSKLLGLQGQYISVAVSGCCDRIFGRIYRVDEGSLVLVGDSGTQIIPISTISLMESGPFAYIVNELGGTVSVIHLPTSTVFGIIVVGLNPEGIAITPDGTKAYVVISSDSAVKVISTVTNTVVGAPIPVGSFPHGIAITPDGARAYVANGFSDSVTVIDTATNTVVGALPAEGALFVTNGTKSGLN